MPVYYGPEGRFDPDHTTTRWAPRDARSGKPRSICHSDAKDRRSVNLRDNRRPDLGSRGAPARTATLAHAEAPQDRAVIYTERVEQLTLAGRWDEAVEVGLAGLEQLGFALPELSQQSLQAELAAVEAQVHADRRA